MGISSQLLKLFIVVSMIMLAMVIVSTHWIIADHSAEMLLHQHSEENVERDVVLLVLIHATAKPEGKARRDFIRHTWASSVILDGISQELHRKVTYKFVLGGKGITRETKNLIAEEILKNGDVIILEDVTDTHETLTHRTLEGLKFIIKENYDFSYLLKCDDDTFVDLKGVVESLKNNKWRKRLYWGDFVGGYDVLNEGLYAEHNWFICDKYIPYAFGGGYVLSRDLVELIQSNAQHLLYYMNEDVSLAAWLSPYNIVRIHDQGFDTGSDSKGCMRPFIVAHKISVKDMFRYYKSLRREGRMCGRRTRSKGITWKRHFYDWSKPPTQCCTRGCSTRFCAKII